MHQMEPSADHRVMANTMRQTFVALTQEGFTEAQSLQIVGFILTAMIQNPQEGDGQ